MDGSVDYTLLRTRLDYELTLLSREQQWVREASTLTPFAPLITGLLEARGRLESMDPAKTATTLDKLAKDIETATKTLDAPARAGGASVVADPVRARQINAFRAAEILSSLRDDLTAWHRFYSGYDPMFTWWAAKPYAQADKALAAYIKALREKVVGYREGEDEPIIGNPIGKAALDPISQSEFIPYTPEELLASRRARVRLVRREMLQGVARHGLRRRLEGGAREGQDAARRARQADRPGPRPGARSRSNTSTQARSGHRPAARRRRPGA